MLHTTQFKAIEYPQSKVLAITLPGWYHETAKRNISDTSYYYNITPEEEELEREIYLSYPLSLEQEIILYQYTNEDGSCPSCGYTEIEYRYLFIYCGHCKAPICDLGNYRCTGSL